MTREDIIAAIDEEISRLEKVKDLLQSASSGKVRGAVTHKPAAGTKKRNLSPDARARIAAAQKRRWAKQKATSNQGGKK